MLWLWQALTPLMVFAVLAPVWFWLFKLSLFQARLAAREPSAKAGAGLKTGLALTAVFMVFTIRLWPDFLIINVYDDEDYLAHATSLAFFQYPSYENEFIPASGRHRPIGAPGCSLMASPFTAAGAAADLAHGAAIGARRTQANLFATFTHFGFVFATSFYFIAAVLLWNLFLSRGFGLLSLGWTLAAGIFSLGLGIFVWRRPVFTHAYEFFLQTVYLFMLLGALGSRDNPVKQVSRLGLVYSLGALSALTVMVRVNNAPFAVLWPALILAAREFGAGFLNNFRDYGQLAASLLKRPLARELLGTALVGLVLIFWFMGLPLFHNPPNQTSPSAYGYLEAAGRNFLNLYSPAIYLKRLAYVLAGPDMGLFYTAPSVILGLWAYFRGPRPLNLWLLPLLAAMAVNLYLVTIWGSHGSSYGYRYLVYSLSPLLMAFLAAFIDRLVRRKARLALTAAVLILVPPVLSQIFFQNAFKLEPALNWFGQSSTMTREYLQFEIYDTLINDTGQFFNYLFKPLLNFFNYPLQNLAEGFYRREVFYWSLIAWPFIYYGFWLFYLKKAGRAAPFGSGRKIPN